MDTEVQIKNLETDIKSLKGAFPIAASKIKTYVQTSQDFTVSGVEKPRFKFTPNYGLGRAQITELRPIVTIGDAPVGFSPFVNLPQDGSGEVTIELQFSPYSPSANYTVKIVASGTSPGSFSML